MTIDPMNAPIFGDTGPADPPRPVRVASGLLLGNVALTAAYRAYTDLDESFPIFLVPLTLAAWFAVSMRSGHGWARTAATLLSCLLIGMMALLIDYRMLDVVVLVFSTGLLLTAIKLMWRSDVNSYFQP
ncbi:MAG TPA: hypothetical protein VFV67_00360 [Actinophytocola sp.]|uniref:hypothetical protein n=1 Tax=Actinophytocola sp. TaxID=1872138 RepID=UPI002DBD37BD|nr:hypothetical protein [Actinophytocola sp.]HEU5469075.1 hypothetical protein [Actinophytocola sp.]